MIPRLMQRKRSRAAGVNLLCGICFVLSGWYFDHLGAGHVLLYALLWAGGYGISFLIDTRYFPVGRAILATLLGSMILYLGNKAVSLFFEGQGWLGQLSTLVFAAGEVVFLFLLLIFTWNTLRALNLQLAPRPEKPAAGNAFLPRVSIHLPISNEPVEVVTKTLEALSRLAYPAYEVIVVDNNTADPALWMPVSDRCDQLGFQFIHVNPLPGYKAGALNLALESSSPECGLIAVVDADYELDPGFLVENVGAFQDPAIAFLQTAQRNRNVGANHLTGAFNPVYDYFYDITLLARNTHNSSIFAGCAGLIRASALQEVGGWAEWSVTEDAELSLRLLKRGYSGVYVNQGYGSGLLPETFVDIRRQWSRYFFGGLEIATRHLFKTILRPSPLTLMQRVDFVMGGMINLGAAIMLLSSGWLILTALLCSLLQLTSPALAGAAFYWLKIFSNWLIIFTCFQVFGVFLLLLVFRLTYQFDWAHAINATGAFLSLMTTQARAAFHLLSGRKLAFQKTPRQNNGPVSEAGIRPVLLELLLCCGLAIALLFLFWMAPAKTAILGHFILGIWQMCIYGATLWNASPSRQASFNPDKERNL